MANSVHAHHPARLHGTQLGKSFRRFQVTAGLILACSENPACFVFFFFSFFFFLLARGLLNFQILAVPIPGRHISVLIPTQAKIDSVTKNKSQLPDEANVIHAETNPETNEREGWCASMERASGFVFIVSCGTSIPSSIDST